MLNPLGIVCENVWSHEINVQIVWTFTSSQDPQNSGIYGEAQITDPNTTVAKTPPKWWTQNRDTDSTLLSSRFLKQQWKIPQLNGGLSENISGCSMATGLIFQIFPGHTCRAMAATHLEVDRRGERASAPGGIFLGSVFTQKYGGFSWGSPIAGWFSSWNIHREMDDDWGYPHDSGNPSYDKIPACNQPWQWKIHHV